MGIMSRRRVKAETAANPPKAAEAKPAKVGTLLEKPKPVKGK